MPYFAAQGLMITGEALFVPRQVRSLFDVFVNGGGAKFPQAHIHQNAVPEARVVPLPDKGYHRHAHVKSIAGCAAARIGECVKGNIYFVVFIKIIAFKTVKGNSLGQDAEFFEPLQSSVAVFFVVKYSRF